MTKQYEPCEHRHGSGLMGVPEPDGYTTPCHHCEAADDFTAWAVGVVLFLAVVALLVWSVS